MQQNQPLPPQEKTKQTKTRSILDFAEKAGFIFKSVYLYILLNEIKKKTKKYESVEILFVFAYEL